MQSAAELLDLERECIAIRSREINFLSLDLTALQLAALVQSLQSQRGSKLDILGTNNTTLIVVLMIECD